ncbi:hypothetical protein OKW21_002386 [Catalinimonas alkaloidigena]|nr:hypothetical protein [Catalinimonas alkaloidigena]
MQSEWKLAKKKASYLARLHGSAVGEGLEPPRSGWC